MTNRQEDFLSRWSRRKVEARQGLRKKEQEAAPAPEEARPPAAGEGGEPVRPGEPVLDEESFADVDFDKLDFSSDYTRFMHKGVPAAIKRRALRKLWTSDPVLACVDGLNDYDLDYTDAATVVKDLKTSWKVGRGFLTDEDLGIAKATQPDTSTAEQEPAQGEAPEREQGEAEQQIADTQAEIRSSSETDKSSGDRDKG